MRTLQAAAIFSAVCLSILAADAVATRLADRADRLRLRDVTVQSHAKHREYRNDRFQYASRKSGGNLTSDTFKKFEAEYKTTDGKRAYAELESLQVEWRDLIWRHPDWSAMFNLSIDLE